MIKGEQKQQSEGGDIVRYVGFTKVEVRAVNPNRDELNKLLGREAAEDEKELTYLSQDADGNDKLRLTFWLYSEDKDKFFPYSLNLTNKEVVSKTGKPQFINTVYRAQYSDSEETLPDFFTHFINENKETKEKTVLGKKGVRKALLGEQELGTFLQSWLGRLNFSKPSAEVFIDPKKLFKENYSELRELIEGDYDSPFIVLLGVRTDKEDKEKQYQQVYGKGFLPANFYNYILKGNKFPSGYAQNIWDKFEKEVNGEYGFKAYFELVPICLYDKSKDPAQSDETQKPAEGVTNINPKF